MPDSSDHFEPVLEAWTCTVNSSDSCKTRKCLTICSAGNVELYAEVLLSCKTKAGCIEA